MTKLSKRKTKLRFVTDAEVRYGGKMRPVVVEAHDGFTASVRLQGTRQRYEFRWHGLHDWAAELHARREKEQRKKGALCAQKGPMPARRALTKKDCPREHRHSAWATTASVCTLAPDGKIEWWIYDTNEDPAVSPCQWQLGRLPQCRAQATDSRDGVRLCKGHAELFDRVVLAVHVYGVEMLELWQDGKFTGTFVRKSQ